MMYPLVRDLAAKTAPVRVPVTCRVLKFSKQAFYKWLKDPVSQRDWDQGRVDHRRPGRAPRRPGVRVSPDRRRTARAGPDRVGEPGGPAVLQPEDLQPIRQETGPAEQAGPGGAR